MTPKQQKKQDKRIKILVQNGILKEYRFLNCELLNLESKNDFVYKIYLINSKQKKEIKYIFENDPIFQLIENRIQTGQKIYLLT